MGFETFGVIFLGIISSLLINYLADVLPLTRQLRAPMCVSCGESLSWKNFVLGEKCPHCFARRPLRFWLILVGVTVGTVWLWLKPPPRLGFGIGFVLMVYMALIATIDIEYRLILHPTSWFGAVLGVGIGIWLHGVRNTLLGGAAGFVIMLSLYFLGAWLARLMARLRGEELDEVALGYGDVNLSGILGLILGWPGILAGLVLAILLGGIVSLFFILGQVIQHRYQPFLAIPYAPFLILGAALLLYHY